MMKKHAKQIPHYLGLMGIFAVGLIGFLLFSYDRTFQIAIVIALAVSYVIWGIVHHHIHKDLHLSVIVEYIVVAALGLVIVFSLVFST
ncbi:hypothetical protein ACFL0F_01505 [Patescibacteria group bacterium]